jgi:type II secretory pathway pseudopilin PulG
MKKRGYTLIELLAVCFMGALSISAVVVAVHFIAKFW